MMKKLPAKWATVVMPFFLSMIMSAIISFIATVKAVGLDANILGLWLPSWAVSWMVAFPVILVVLPLVRRIVFMVVEKP